MIDPESTKTLSLIILTVKVPTPGYQQPQAFDQRQNSLGQFLILTADKTGTEAALTYAGTTHREKESIIYTVDAIAPELCESSNHSTD